MMGSPVKSSQSFPITDDQGNALHSPATVAEKFRAFYSSHGSQIPAADKRDVEFSLAIEDAIAYKNPNSKTRTSTLQKWISASLISTV
jgi:hypothetical protein